MRTLGLAHVNPDVSESVAAMRERAAERRPG
jgi:hypothetical protein